ncbi:hypothetical protein NMS_2173 [Nonlabens marinus S1-08]|uniref:Uncharacterized protein n=1 Tax=Nonlabens marinus S1-08 TaxID=1454201 RepID=W8VXM4_9FLAO|nr:hypothetical protein NMS_2173 [Nonlabens marinus S1-08]
MYRLPLREDKRWVSQILEKHTFFTLEEKTSQNSTSHNSQ